MLSPVEAVVAMCLVAGIVNSSEPGVKAGANIKP